MAISRTAASSLPGTPGVVSSGGYASKTPKGTVVQVARAPGAARMGGAPTTQLAPWCWARARPGVYVVGRSKAMCCLLGEGGLLSTCRHSANFLIQTANYCVTCAHRAVLACLQMLLLLLLLLMHTTTSLLAAPIAFSCSASASTYQARSRKPGLMMNANAAATLLVCCTSVFRYSLRLRLWVVTRAVHLPLSGCLTAILNSAR
jgi:hypothetical protein